MRNLARTIERGLDLDIQHSFDTRFGLFRWTLEGAYLFTFGQAVTSGSPVIELADTTTNPLAVKARSALGWYQQGKNLSGFSIEVTGNYAGSYRDTSVSERRVGAWSTLDFNLSYRAEADGRWFDGLQISLGGTNVLNADPPFVNNMNGYDAQNVQATGRMLVASIQKSW